MAPFQEHTWIEWEERTAEMVSCSGKMKAGNHVSFGAEDYRIVAESIGGYTVRLNVGSKHEFDAAVAGRNIYLTSHPNIPLCRRKPCCCLFVMGEELLNDVVELHHDCVVIDHARLS